MVLAAILGRTGVSSVILILFSMEIAMVMVVAEGLLYVVVVVDFVVWFC